MVYSSGVRGIQQDAKEKAGVEVITKVKSAGVTEAHNQLETSDLSDLTESYLKSAMPSRPTHSNSLPTPVGIFGRPQSTYSSQPIRSATQTPLTISPGPGTPVSVGEGQEDEKDNVKRAFDAFGPRVGGGGGGGSFARPRPAGKR